METSRQIWAPVWTLKRRSTKTRPAKNQSSRHTHAKPSLLKSKAISSKTSAVFFTKKPTSPPPLDILDAIVTWQPARSRNVRHHTLPLRDTPQDFVAYVGCLDWVTLYTSSLWKKRIVHAKSTTPRVVHAHTKRPTHPASDRRPRTSECS